jgi:hypothetical protein
MSYSPATYMQQSLVESQETSQLYNTAMQGLSSYANNIMGHTMNQYAAQVPAQIFKISCTNIS